ncbi:hypothetical protein QJS04_geneDACA003897 [Acorus gramineus]|uniref:Uncharacterized protein n=1 Tax=Acorus gramineus TaxID=55184 RepID=A0AAV9BFY4_ACOGR|nr:hypothetical protein QJS04_geneDACA003897 [Acorus gramineus]
MENMNYWMNRVEMKAGAQVGTAGMHGGKSDCESVPSIGQKLEVGPGPLTGRLVKLGPISDRPD